MNIFNKNWKEENSFPLKYLSRYLENSKLLIDD